MSLAFEKMRAYDPNRDPVVNAIRTLESEEEIRLFVEGYVEWMKEAGDLKARENPRATCLANVEFLLGHFGYNSEVHKKWTKAVPELKSYTVGQMVGVTYTDSADLSSELGFKLEKRSNLDKK
jgi:hypothetical protein